MRKAYILMADVVDNGSKNSNVVIKELRKAVEHINAKYKKAFLSPATITLGDEFQAIVETLTYAVEMIVDIEEYIITNSFSIQLKYVVVFGTINTRINTKIAYEMLGPGLTNARESLEKFKSFGDKRMYFDVQNNALSDTLINTFTLFTGIVQRWNRRDYKLISAFLAHKTYKDVADKLKKDRSQIWRKEKTLMMKEYFAIKNVINYTSKVNAVQ